MILVYTPADPAWFSFAFCQGVSLFLCCRSHNVSRGQAEHPSSILRSNDRCPTNCALISWSSSFLIFFFLLSVPLPLPLPLPESKRSLPVLLNHGNRDRCCCSRRSWSLWGVPHTQARWQRRGERGKRGEERKGREREKRCIFCTDHIVCSVVHKELLLVAEWSCLSCC